MNTSTVGTKLCKVCGEEKSVSDFNRCSVNKDGLRGYCRQCQKAKHKEYRDANLDRERERVRRWRQENPDYARQWREQHPGYHKRYEGRYLYHRPKATHPRPAPISKAELSRRHYARNPEAQRGRVQRWRSENPNASKAHTAVRWAQHFGILPKISGQMCVECGGQATQYHHTQGYDEQHWLTVVPVCVSCHKIIHSHGVL